MATEESSKPFLNWDEISQSIDSEAKAQAKYLSRDTISGDERSTTRKTSRESRRSSKIPARKTNKKRQRKRSPAQESALPEMSTANPAALPESERPPPRKLRPASQILSHLLHTPHLYHPSDFHIGYLDRFACSSPSSSPSSFADIPNPNSSGGGGIIEIPLPLWAQQSSDTTNDEFIPLHRIRYVRHKDLGVRVWDREARRDLLKERESESRDGGDEEEEEGGVREFGDVFGCWEMGG